MGRRKSALRRTWPQRLLLGFNSLLVVACLALAAGMTMFETKLSNVSTVSIDSAEAGELEASEPRNILIVGTDSAANLDPDDPVLNGREAGKLADVIMIMRIDPATGTARLLSIPRDTRLEIAPSGYMERVNSAIAGVDGPKNLISTIKRNFGISIDNFVQVDFAGFKDLVEQLGGVPVYFAAPVRDKNSGLFVESAGCVMLGPDQALAYARARHFQFMEDGKWKYDQTGDLGRITRQQDFIKRSLRRASDMGIRNPSTAFGVVDAASQSVQMDETLNVGAILQLIDSFQDFNPDELVTDQLPTFAAPRGGVAYQDVDWDEVGGMLLPYWGFGADRTLAPRDIVVDVSGSRNTPELLDFVSAGLDTFGFDAEPLPVRRSVERTSIAYGHSGFDAALQLATHLNGVPELVYDEELVGPRLVLSVGEGFEGLRETPVSVDELPPELRAAGTSTTEAPAEAAQDPGSGDAEVPPAPVAEDPAVAPEELPFVTASEMDGAPPGIVPTDPAKAATCR